MGGGKQKWAGGGGGGKNLAARFDIGFWKGREGGGRRGWEEELPIKIQDRTDYLSYACDCEGENVVPHILTYIYFFFVKFRHAWLWRWI